MKKYIFAMILMLTSTALMAEWKVISINEESTTYVDTKTIRRNGSQVKMWTLRDYQIPQNEGSGSYYSSKNQMVFDCKNESFKILGYYDYSGNMGNGNSVDYYIYPNPRSIPIVPKTIVEREWEIACGK